MKTIVLDTNFIIYCAKYKIDLFSEIDRICLFPYKLSVVDKTINELEKLKPNNYALIKKYLERLEIIKTEEDYADNALIALSKKGHIVATQDLELKKQLKAPVIIIRQKKYLDLKV